MPIIPVKLKGCGQAALQAVRASGGEVGIEWDLSGSVVCWRRVHSRRELSFPRRAGHGLPRGQRQEQIPSVRRQLPFRSHTRSGQQAENSHLNCLLSSHFFRNLLNLLAFSISTTLYTRYYPGLLRQSLKFRKIASTDKNAVFQAPEFPLTFGIINQRQRHE